MTNCNGQTNYNIHGKIKSMITQQTKNNPEIKLAYYSQLYNKEEFTNFISSLNEDNFPNVLQELMLEHNAVSFELQISFDESKNYKDIFNCMESALKAYQIIISHMSILQKGLLVQPAGKELQKKIDSCSSPLLEGTSSYSKITV